MVEVISEQVVLVDERDAQVGTMEKMEAHRTGRLHRAFSVFLFDDRGRTLLQQRALTKYHGQGLWSNACCSHPRPGEETMDAAHRRCMEELGLTIDLHERFAFMYRAVLDNGLIEHEFDHVFTGLSTDDPVPDPKEVMSTRWVTREELERELDAHPERFTPWLPLCWPRVSALLEGHERQ